MSKDLLKDFLEDPSKLEQTKNTKYALWYIDKNGNVHKYANMEPEIAIKRATSILESGEDILRIEAISTQITKHVFRRKSK